MTLLEELSDEELDQYARLADDQIARENRFAWAQVALGLLAVATFAWTLVLMAQGGFDRMRVAALGLAGLMFYWPWRKAKARRIWLHHIDATREEQARRADAVGRAGRDGSP